MPADESFEVREQRLRTISKRLLIVTVLMLLGVVALFGIPLAGFGRFPISWLAFGVGVIGGFVSIQQRLKNLPDDELRYLSSSRLHVVLHPFFGGIFALVLYVLFLSGLLEGSLFPDFTIPAFASPPTAEDIRTFLLETYPASGQDVAKLIFWSFAAGFSERLVPDIVRRTADGAGGPNANGAVAPLGGTSERPVDDPEGDDNTKAVTTVDTGEGAAEVADEQDGTDEHTTH